MSVSTLLKKAFLEGYATQELNIPTTFVCILFTTAIGLFIYLIYRMVNKNGFQSRSFSLSLVALAVITSAIILTIQSNIVISLGMVGALSIVRFRTAIKDPMDLVFLFWSISVGIICGAGFALIAVIMSIAIAIVIILFSVLPGERDSMVLIVNSPGYDCEGRVLSIVKKHTRAHKVRARNITADNLNLAIEVRTSRPADLIEALMESKAVTTVSLLEHDGEITA